jgi:hypothetical protein
MNAVVRWSLLLALVGVAVILGSDDARAEEVIADGGFESGSIQAAAPGQPVTYGTWLPDDFPAGEPSRVEAVTDPVLSGDYAAQVDTLTAPSGRFIFQDFQGGTQCFTWTFSVYPQGGVSTAELLQDWDRGAGQAQFVSAVTFTDAGIAFSGWGKSASSPDVIDQDQWHTIVVEANTDNRTQTFTVDGDQKASLDIEVADSTPETIILGDVAGQAGHGLYTYDDVSLDVRQCAHRGGFGPTETSAGSATNAAAISEEPEDDGGFPWWIVLLVILVAAGLFLFFALWRRRRKPEAGQ